MPASEQAQALPSPEFSLAWIAASDPGLLRVRFAGRVLFSVMITAGALYLLGKFARIPFKGMSLGLVVSVFGNVAVRDAGAARQAVTMLLLSFPAAAGVALAAVTGGIPLLRDGCFLAIVFGATFARGWGPRWAAIGMLGFTAFFMSQYLHLSVHQLPFQLLGLAVGIATAALVRFALLPDRPQAALGRLMVAIDRLMAMVLGKIADALDARRWTSGQRRFVRQNLAGLNQVALIAERQMDVIAARNPHGDIETMRLRLFRLEQALDALANLALETPDPPQSQSIVDELRRLESDLRPGSSSVESGREPNFARGALPGQAVSGFDDLGTALSNFRNALDAVPGSPGERPSLPEAASGAARGSGLARPDPAKPDPEPHPRQSFGLAPSTLQAIQVTIACGLAIGAGSALSAQRWSWAVITVFVIFAGAGSRGDAAYKGVQRIIGTVLGVVAGVLVATWLTRQTYVEGGLLLTSLFLAFYAFQASYAIFVFWLTMMLALLYGLMGYFSPDLLWLRLEETGVGAVAGIGVATLLLPVRTRDAISAALHVFYLKLDAVVAEALQSWREGRREPGVEAARALDRSFQAARAALQPLTLGREFHSHGNAGRQLELLIACRSAAQQLSASVERPADARQLEELERTAVEVKRALVRLLGKPSADGGGDTDAPPQDAETPRSHLEASDLSARGDHAAMRALRDLRDALHDLLEIRR